MHEVIDEVFTRIEDKDLNIKEITKEEYGHYLKLPYEIFAKALHMSDFWSEGPYDYSYCTSKDNDNDEARLSYIKYLVNEKGFAL